MIEIRNWRNVRVAICEDFAHVQRLVERMKLNKYSLYIKRNGDGLDQFSELISGRVM